MGDIFNYFDDLKILFRQFEIIMNNHLYVIWKILAQQFFLNCQRNSIY
jgi:hypothetical protein